MLPSPAVLIAGLLVCGSVCVAVDTSQDRVATSSPIAAEDADEDYKDYLSSFEREYLSESELETITERAKDGGIETIVIMQRAEDSQHDAIEGSALNGTVPKNGTAEDEDELMAAHDVAMRKTILFIRFILEGLVVALISTVGILGNLLSMFILLKRKLDLQPFLCQLLVLLVVFDTVFLFTDFLTYSLPMLNRYYHDYVYPLLSPHFLLPLSQVALTGSVYSIVAITVERYISCCWPHVPPRDNRKQNALCILAIIAFSFAFNTTRFFEFITIKRLSDECYVYITAVKQKRIEPNETITENCKQNMPLEITMGELRQDPNYISYYMMASNCTVMVLIPFASLVGLNWQIHKALKKREQFKASLARQLPVNSNVVKDHEEDHHKKERDLTVTQILVAIVIMFFICQSFKIIVVGYEVVTHIYFGPSNKQPYPMWVEIVINLNHVALALNAAINIVIYICKDKKFRTLCSDLFRCTRMMRFTMPPSLSSDTHRDMTVLGPTSHPGSRGSRRSAATCARPSCTYGCTCALSPRSAHAHATSAGAAFVPRRDVVVDLNGMSRSADTSKTDFSSSEGTTTRAECAECERHHERDGLLASVSDTHSQRSSSSFAGEVSTV